MHLIEVKRSMTAVVMVSTKVNMESMPNVMSMRKNRKDLRNIFILLL